MTNFINLTPHPIKLNSGEVFQPLSTDPKECARVSASFRDLDGLFCEQTFGEIYNLPDPVHGVVYIVSAIVKKAAADRDDVVAPATGHPDTVRNEKGHVVSVPRFVQR